MKKIRRIGFWTSVSCALIAGAMSTNPLEIHAATQGAYISDVIVITENDVEKAKADNWTVMSAPLGDQNYRVSKTGGSFTKTYLAYKTTSDVNNAIQDMKFMNMYGGWSFAEYDEYLDALDVETKTSTNQLFTAIEGYRKAYQAGTKQGLFAHDALNYFNYDENYGLENETDLVENPIQMKFGDLLLNEELVPNGDSSVLVDVFMEGNAQFLDIFYSVLSIANSRNDEGKSLFEVLEDIKDNYNDYIDRTDLNDVLSVFEIDFDRIREEINWYTNENTVMFEDFDTDAKRNAYTVELLAEDLENQTNYVDMWQNAPREKAFLENILYKGVSGNYNNLCELIMDENAESYEYYPLLVAMTPGVRATALLGIIDILTNELLDEDSYMSRFDALKNSDEEIKTLLEEGQVPIFFGVDRTLYRKGNVAMTTSAQEGAARGDQDWKTISSKRDELNNKLENIFKYASIGSGGLLGLAGVGLISTRGFNNVAASGVIQAVEDFTAEDFSTLEEGAVMFKTDNLTITKAASTLEDEAGFIEGVADDVPERIGVAVENGATKGNPGNVASSASKGAAAKVSSSGLAIMKGILITTVVIAVIALVVSLVLYFLNHAKDDKPTYMKYTAVPGILCHKQNVYDISKSGTKTPAKNQGYVYYYGATNPYTVATKAKFGNDDDGTLELGENKRNVQDIFNWELGEGKNREWVCLYYTKDAKAAFPITTSSLKINSTLGTKVEGATSFSNSDVEYNLNYILQLNYLDDRALISNADDILKLPKSYLHFKMNTRALAKSSSIGSVVSEPTFWGIVIIALVVGFGGGFLTFHLINKKKKKSVANA